MMNRRAFSMAAVAAIIGVAPAAAQVLKTSTQQDQQVRGNWKGTGGKAAFKIDNVDAGGAVTGTFKEPDGTMVPIGAWSKGTSASATFRDGVLKLTLASGNQLELTLSAAGDRLSGKWHSLTGRNAGTSADVAFVKG